MRTTISIVIVLVHVLALSAKENFWIQDGDEVLFWGDSITDDGVYPRIVENYVLTHYPDWNVTFYNLGWSGDRSSFYPRLERDIKLCKPTKVTIMLGMNDGLYRAPDPQVLQTYVGGIYKLLEILKNRSNPEVFLISATPFDYRNRSDIANGYQSDPRRLSRAIDYKNKWNRDLLIVTNLDSGLYELRMDDELLDIVPSDELEQGLNLSDYATSPLMRQAYQVFEATEQRQDAFYAKWRYVLLQDVRRPNQY